MKKYILAITIFTFLILPHVTFANAASPFPSAKVVSGTLTDSSDGKSVIAKFTFELDTTLATTTLKIPEDGFQILLEGANDFEGASGDIMSLPKGVTKEGAIYSVSSGLKDITLTISAAFNKSDLYNGNHLASFDGIYFITQIDPADSKTVLGEYYSQSHPNLTNSLNVTGQQDPQETPYSNYKMANLKLSEGIDAESKNPTAVVSLQVTVRATTTPIIIYKSGVSMTNASGTAGTTTIQNVSANMIDGGSFYTIPKNSTGLFQIQSIFFLTDLPHDQPYSLTVALYKPDNVSSTSIVSPKKSFLKKIVSELGDSVKSTYNTLLDTNRKILKLF